MHPNLAHLLLTINEQQGRESNKLAFCSSLTTSTCLALLQQTHAFWLWTDLHRTHTQRSPKAWSPTACTHITTRSQTNHSQMDVLPAHLNRDSFRDSFKGLVALEIILDLPFGFPINNIISLLHLMSSRFCLYLLNTCHFTYTFSHAHTEAHTHKHTCIISTQEEWRQPDTGAWLRGAGKRLLLRAKALHTHRKRRKMSGKTDIDKSKAKESST